MGIFSDVLFTYYNFVRSKFQEWRRYLKKEVLREIIFLLSEQVRKLQKTNMIFVQKHDRFKTNNCKLIRM